MELLHIFLIAEQSGHCLKKVFFFFLIYFGCLLQAILHKEFVSSQKLVFFR